jgi:hypothetical protein
VLELIEDCLPKPVDWKGLGAATWAVVKARLPRFSRARAKPAAATV